MAALSDLKPSLKQWNVELIGLWLETNIINLCMWVLSIVIFVIVYGRMIEIYLTVSLAPIPFSTMANREWGQMGTGICVPFALGFQGFDPDLCCHLCSAGPVYPIVRRRARRDLGNGGLYGTAGFALFKTGSLSKSIFNAR